jgi:predicted porin
MKKSLLAVAAMTAFAGAAQAQSSVTVYGILDVGYVGSNSKSTVNNKQSAETRSFLGQSAETSSRLGFKGTEDLGGGTSAFFTFETGLSPNDSTLSGFNNRQAFVGLAKKGLGNAAIGTQNTTIHQAVAITSANQQNNIVGDAIYPQNTGITNTDGSASNANAGYTVRTNNTIQLQSDKFAGFQAKAFYALNNKNNNQGTGTTTTVTGGTNNTNGYGLGVNYNWQKLLVSANYQSFKQETDAGANGAASAYSISSTGSVTATNVQDNQTYVAATYDFGILKAYAQWINRKVESTLDSSNYAKRSAQQLGVRSFITPKIEAWASIGNGRIQSFGVNNPTANFNAYQLGSNYWLSKRTNLYAIFGGSNTSTTQTASGATNNANSNNYAVGVRHSF